MLLSFETIGKRVFSVKLCISTHEGKGRRTALCWMWAAHKQDGVRLEQERMDYDTGILGNQKINPG